MKPRNLLTSELFLECLLCYNHLCKGKQPMKQKTNNWGCLKHTHFIMHWPINEQKKHSKKFSSALNFLIFFSCIVITSIFQVLLLWNFCELKVSVKKKKEKSQADIGQVSVETSSSTSSYFILWQNVNVQINLNFFESHSIDCLDTEVSFLFKTNWN